MVDYIWDTPHNADRIKYSTFAYDAFFAQRSTPTGGGEDVYWIKTEKYNELWIMLHNLTDTAGRELKLVVKGLFLTYSGSGSEWTDDQVLPNPTTETDDKDWAYARNALMTDTANKSNNDVSNLINGAKDEGNVLGPEIARAFKIVEPFTFIQIILQSAATTYNNGYRLAVKAR